MRRSIAGTLGVLLACQIPAVAQEHLIPRETVQARLNAAAAERAESIAVLEVLLDTPEAEKACKASGISGARLKRQLPLLTDDELRELARRAADLRTDPTAGMSSGGKIALIVGVLVVILVVLAVVLTRETVNAIVRPK
jgi:hypothetical protein